MSSRKRSPKSKALNPLTERAAEVNPEVSESSESPQSESPEQSGGLLQNLSNLFRSSPEPSPQVSPESSPASSPESTISKPLTPEIESALSAVPDVVGGPEVLPPGEVEPDEVAEAAAVATSNKAKIEALLALGYFDEVDGGDLADSLFDSIAEKLDSDHWKLDDKRRQKIGRNLAACLNGLLEWVFDKLPDGTGEAVQAHPEVTALGSSVAAAAVPRAIKHVKVMRNRRNGVVNVAAVEAPATAAAPAENKKRPAVERGPLGIPVYSGKLQ